MRSASIRSSSPQSGFANCHAPRPISETFMPVSPNGRSFIQYSLGLSEPCEGMPSHGSDYLPKTVSISFICSGVNGPNSIALAFSSTWATVLNPGMGIVFSLLPRSEEHTSELQSQSNLVCRLLLEKKKKKKQISSLL